MQAGVGKGKKSLAHMYLNTTSAIIAEVCVQVSDEHPSLLKVKFSFFGDLQLAVCGVELLCTVQTLVWYIESGFRLMWSCAQVITHMRLLK